MVMSKCNTEKYSKQDKMQSKHASAAQLSNITFQSVRLILNSMLQFFPSRNKQ